MKALTFAELIAILMVITIITVIAASFLHHSSPPQTPAQVYDECVKRIPSEFMTIELYQDEIEICLQVASSTQSR